MRKQHRIRGFKVGGNWTIIFPKPINKRLLFLLLIALTMAACSTTDDAPDSEDANLPPTQTPIVAIEGGEERVSVTLDAPPQWIPAGTTIDLNNIAQIGYLGRLDSRIPSTAFSHAFAPDGTQLAALNNTDLIVWDLISGDTIFETTRGDATQVFFSSGKDEIYTVAPDGTITIYDALNGRPLNTLQGHDAYSGAALFDAERDLLVLGGEDQQVKVWDVPERVSLVTLGTAAGQINALAFSPDGATLALGGSFGTVELWDWAARQPLNLLDAQANNVHDLIFSPDGSQVAAGTRATVMVWDVASGDLQLQLFTGEGGSDDVMRYSPDGRYLITGGRVPDMMLWDMASGARLGVLEGVGGETVSAAFSPDGDVLVTSVRGGDVAIWNMQSVSEQGIARAGIQLETDRIFKVDWSPDRFALIFFDELGPIYVWGISGE